MTDTEYDTTSETEYDTDDERSSKYEYYQVYAMGRFKKFAGKNHRLANLIYFMTFGGGPEGGYVWDKRDNIVYSVRRNWGIPFSITAVYHNKTIDIDYEEESIAIIDA